ncbi:MAG: ABC transporter permease subunit [Sphaerochaetaceae bacterium]|jgi:ABC-type transport system involved in multi-copper enzyme maturation permease subunit
MTSAWYGARYDFKDRIRNFSFLVLTALAALGTFLAVPNLNSPVTTMVIEPRYFAQASDPSWISMATATCMGIFLPLVGVIYCQNTISRDNSTGVLSLIRTSPMNRFSYLFSKFLSNCFILFFVLAVIIVGSLVMVFIRFPNQRLSAYSFLTPFLPLLPGLMFCASMSVLLESITLRFPQTGNGIGTILFFTMYLTTLTFSVLGSDNLLVRIFDFSGFGWLKASIDSVVYPQIGHTARFTVLAGGDAIQNSPDLPALVFTGLVPSWRFFTDKILLCAFSLCTVVLSMVIMPEHERNLHVRKQRAKKELICTDKRQNTVRISSALPIELKMAIRGRPKFWWIGLFGLWCGAAFAPMSTAQNIVLPLLFGWSFMVYSQMGCREYQCHVVQSLKSINGAFSHQGILNLLIGVCFSITITFPLLVRMAIEKEFSGLCACLTFCLFVPALAFFLGEITESPRPFEIIFLFLCYLMLNHPPIIIGISKEYVSMSRTVLILFLSIIMLLIACGKRRVVKG